MAQIDIPGKEAGDARPPRSALEQKHAGVVRATKPSLETELHCNKLLHVFISTLLMLFHATFNRF